MERRDSAAGEGQTQDTVTMSRPGEGSELEEAQLRWNRPEKGKG